MNTKPNSKSFSSNLLLGQRALVTGAGKGIGREIATVLCEAGASVWGVARTEADLVDLQKQFPEQVTVWVRDVTSDSFVEEMVQFEFDILVNNVGTNRPGPFVEVSKQDLDLVIDLNVKALFRITQSVVQSMLERRSPGSIVNVSSQMGSVGSPNRSVYCASKHAVEGLSKALAVELAESGIRINTVAPTFVLTPMTKPMLDDPKFEEFVLGNIPMKQLASMRDVANAVAFLASDLSSTTTGSCIKVDGGWTAQ